MLDLIEIEDGLLMSKDHVICKARNIDLLNKKLQNCVRDSTQLIDENIEVQHTKVLVSVNGRKVYFNRELFEYISKHKNVTYYLSAVPLPGEDETILPLIGRYAFGLIMLAPLEVV